MGFDHVLDEVSSRVGCLFQSAGGYEVNHFCGPVRDGQDGVVGSNIRWPLGQAQYPVDVDRLPFQLWYQQRLDFSS